MLSYNYLLDLALILLSTKALGIITKKFKMPQVVGALLAGLVFGPAILNILKETNFIIQLAELGVILLMFTPFAYYCFSGFTENAYARWYIFITVISLIFIAVQYDKRDEMSVWYLDLSFGIVIFIYGYLITYVSLK